MYIVEILDLFHQHHLLFRKLVLEAKLCDILLVVQEGNTCVEYIGNVLQAM